MSTKTNCPKCGEYAGSHQKGRASAFCDCACHDPSREAFAVGEPTDIERDGES